MMRARLYFQVEGFANPVPCRVKPTNTRITVRLPSDTRPAVLSRCANTVGQVCRFGPQTTVQRGGGQAVLAFLL
jgi:hypothetical protein